MSNTLLRHLAIRHTAFQSLPEIPTELPFRWSKSRSAIVVLVSPSAGQSTSQSSYINHRQNVHVLTLDGGNHL